MKQKLYGAAVTAAALILVAAIGAEIVTPLWQNDGTALESGSSDPVYINGNYICLLPDTDLQVDGPESALAAASDIFGLADSAADVLSEKQVTEIDGETYYQFTQKYQKLPVYGRSVSLAVDEDHSIFLAAGNYDPINLETLTPEISCAEAQEAAETYVETVMDLGAVASLELNGFSEENLCVYNLEDPSHPRLAYQCELLFDAEKESGCCELLIDACTGEVLRLTSSIYTNDSVNLNYTQLWESEEPYGKGGTVSLEKSGDTYVFKNDPRNLSLYHCEGDYLSLAEPRNIITNANTTMNITDVAFYPGEPGKEAEEPLSVYQMSEKTVYDMDDKKALFLLDNAEYTYDFYYEILHRTGFNGNNGKTLLVCGRREDKGLSGSDNAGSLVISPYVSILLFNRGAEVNEIELVAHEFTHSVEKSICNLEYSGQSGCLSEAYADIFGELAEAYQSGTDPDWLHGNRDLRSPARGAILSALYGSQLYFFDQFYDGVDPHSSSTIVSYCAYLLWDTWRHEGGMDTADCMNKMANLLYRTLFLLPKQAELADWRWCMQQIGFKMYLGGELDGLQYTQLAQALGRTGIPDSGAGSQLSVWENALMEICCIAAETNTQTLTPALMTEAAARLLPVAAEEISDYIPAGSYYLDSNQLYVNETAFSYYLYALFGETNGDAALQYPGCFREIPFDPEDPHAHFDYIAEYTAPEAAQAGWKITDTHYTAAPHGSIELIMSLLSPDNREYTACFLLEHGTYPGAFFNSYSVTDFKLSFDRAAISDADTDTDIIQNIASDPETILPDLILQYGVIPAGTFSFSGGASLLEQVVPPEQLTGLLSADIYDYDGDGQEELLTLRLDGSGYETGTSNHFSSVTGYLSVYEAAEQTADAGAEITPAAELSFSMPALPDSQCMASLQLFRTDGEAPSIYLDYYMNMDAQSFGIAAFQYDGEQLFVTGGAECSEWPDYAGSLKCDILKDAAGLQSLCGNLTGASGEREGWSSGPWYDWDGASDSSLSGGQTREYYESFQAELGAIGISETAPHSYLFVDGKFRFMGLADSCSRRPSERLTAADGNLVELCGVLSPYTDGKVQLTCYDDTGILDTYR